MNEEIKKIQYHLCMEMKVYLTACMYSLKIALMLTFLCLVIEIIKGITVNDFLSIVNETYLFYITILAAIFILWILCLIIQYGIRYYLTKNESR